MDRFSDVCQGTPPKCANCGGTEFALSKRRLAKAVVATAAVAVGTAGPAGIAMAPAVVIAAPVAAAVGVGVSGVAAYKVTRKRIQCQTCFTDYKPG